jgi:excisionase family DNA binding protein
VIVHPELFDAQRALALLDPVGRCPQPCRRTLKDYPEVGRVDEVAAVLRCSKSCVYDLINTGALKSIRLGRAIRVTRRALEEFLAG